MNNLYGVQLGSLCSGLLRVVVRCKVLQYVAVYCSVLQWIWRLDMDSVGYSCVLRCAAVRCSVLLCVVAYCSV